MGESAALARKEKNMRLAILFTASVYMVVVAPATLAFAEDQKKPPESVVFQAKNGNVTFSHQKHVDREKGDCKVCHPKVFAESNAPINFKASLHRTAEASKTACAACHFEGGPTFASKGNCGKCHVKGAAPTT